MADQEGDTTGEAGHESGDSGDEDSRPVKKRVKLDMSCLEQAVAQVPRIEDARVLRRSSGRL